MVVYTSCRTGMWQAPSQQNSGMTLKVQRFERHAPWGRAAFRTEEVQAL